RKLHVDEWISAASEPILKAQTDGVDRLNEHGFFVPVRPDQLHQARLTQFLAEEPVARFCDILLTKVREDPALDAGVGEFACHERKVWQGQTMGAVNLYEVRFP